MEQKGEWDSFKFNCASTPFFGSNFNIFKLFMVTMDIAIVLSVAYFVKQRLDEEIIKCGVNMTLCNYTTINGMV
jgi:hypothetical protein